MTDNVAIVIPWRDRGTDPLRQANLKRVLEHWADCAPVHVVDDGRTGSAQFNRSAAYNRGRKIAGDVDVIIYTESDMLLGYDQILEAIDEANEAPGLVVPFTQYRYLSPEGSRRVRAHDVHPAECTPESTMDNGSSIGAVNVVSRETLELVGGYDEAFEGSWYDDSAMRIAFDKACGPTRWVNGPAHHLYHLPGWKGDHLTEADRAATARNKARYALYEQAQTPERIRQLTAGGN